MLLVGIGLAQGGQRKTEIFADSSKLKTVWQDGLNVSRQGLFLPAIFVIMGILSGLTITHNLGYQKYYRPDHFLTLLNQTPSSETRWIVSPHQSLVQTGELLGVALEAERHFSELAPQLRFLLLPATHSRDPVVIEQLQQHLDQQTEPIDLWVVNYLAPIALGNCQKDQTSPQNIYGYSYQHFTCPSPATTTAAP